jgi:hypothetical protein
MNANRVRGGRIKPLAAHFADDHRVTHLRHATAQRDSSCAVTHLCRTSGAATTNSAAMSDLISAPRPRSPNAPESSERERHCCIELARHSPARREATYRRFVPPGIDPSGVV